MLAISAAKVLLEIAHPLTLLREWVILKGWDIGETTGDNHQARVLFTPPLLIYLYQQFKTNLKESNNYRIAIVGPRKYNYSKKPMSIHTPQFNSTYLLHN